MFELFSLTLSVILYFVFMAVCMFVGGVLVVLMSVGFEKFYKWARKLI